MFRVKHVTTGEILTVYGMNGMYFLVWDPDRGCWGWVQMEKYAPVAEPCDAPYWATEQAYKNGFEAGKREQAGPGAEDLKVLVRDTATREEIASDPEVLEKKLKARLGEALYGLATVQLCYDDFSLQVNGHALIVVKPVKGAGRPDHG